MLVKRTAGITLFVCVKHAACALINALPRSTCSLRVEHAADMTFCVLNVQNHTGLKEIYVSIRKSQSLRWFLFAEGGGPFPIEKASSLGEASFLLHVFEVCFCC